MRILLAPILKFVLSFRVYSVYAHSHIAALNAFFYLNQLSGNPDQTAEAGNPAVGKYATAHAQSILFPESSEADQATSEKGRWCHYSRESAVWKLLPGW